MTSEFHAPSTSTTPTVLTDNTQTKRMGSWRLLLPLLFQSAIILSAPALPFYTTVTGRTVILKTLPVDPYDFLRGYSQTLSYDISRVNTLKRLPGWQALVEAKPPLESSEALPRGTSFYIVLEAPTQAEANPPKHWKPVAVSGDRPTNLQDNQIALKGKYKGEEIEYGLETYYMPEARRDEINEDINQANAGQQRQSIVVEAKVDAQGRSVPISFWVGDRHYQF